MAEESKKDVMTAAEPTGGEASTQKAEPTGGEASPQKAAEPMGDGGGLLGAEPKEAEAPKEAETPREGEASSGDEGKKEALPEIVYEAFKLGDGLAADDETMQSFTDFAKKHRLSQEEAQGLVDLQNGLAEKSAKANRERFDAEVRKMTDKWVAEVKADPELGGADIGYKMAECRRVCKALGVPEAVDVLQTAQMGSNPVILKLLYRASQAIKEDRFAAGSNAVGGVSAAKALYPSMN